MDNKNGRSHWLRPWLTAIIVAIFLLPAIRTPGGLPSVRGEELIFIPFILYCMFRVIKGKNVVFAWGVRQNLFVVFFVFLFVSVLSGLMLGYNAKYGDLNQIVRFVKYILVYTLSSSFIHVGNQKLYKRRKFVFNLFILCSVIASLIAVQQFFDIFSLNSAYVEYVAPTAHDSLLGDYPFPRPVAMIGNPNEVGFAFVLGGLTATYCLIKRGGWRFFVAMIVNFIAVGLTLSRTAFVALIVGSGYLYGMQLFVGRRSTSEKLKYLFFPTGVLIAAIAYLLANPVLFETIGWRLYTLLEFQSTSSWQVRVRGWQQSIKLFLENPLLGVGPLRGAEITPEATDNEWLQLLRTYGIVGTLVLTIGVIWPHLRAKSGLLRVFISAILISTAVYMIPAAVFHSLSLMPLLLVLIATEDPTVRRVTLL
ncbi:O-antigen ligase family protein [Salinibacter ruber]|uniref:O-antigen ligase family protein n=1 Tax=Salinibacter ruber TaxID=146919 RepID=UPI002168731E|nr:O-antigen ligase family protein [Salinibacter ruber]MCS3702312.1 hypothetical protein [Salinibacter ruber]